MIPAGLRELVQWVVWRYETRETKDGPRPTKVPYVPSQPEAKASSTDHQTWGTFLEAANACSTYRRFEGIGFVFSPDDPYVGVDMDHCFLRSGALHHGAYEVEKLLRGYVEFSPSGDGLHIIVRGAIERGRHTLSTPWGNELAVYDRGRFFTMGDEGRGDLRDAQHELDLLFARFFPEPTRTASTSPREPFSGDDAELVEWMFRAANGDRIEALWRGDLSAHGGDHSAADEALCFHLAFWTGGDPARMDALFRRSALARPKWDEKRGDTTYGQRTIARAVGVG